jgi:hypothetical protein
MTVRRNPLVDALVSCSPCRLGEINLLLEVLSKSGRSIEVTNRALLQMASKSDYGIKSEQYIVISKELGLVYDQNRELELTAFGRRFVSLATWPPFDRLNQSQIDLIAPEIISHPSIKTHIISILNRMSRLSNSNYVYHLGSQQFDQEEIVTLHLLQLLEFISADQNYLYLSNTKYLSLVSCLGELPFLSEEDFWNNIKETNLRARVAEEYVVKYEKSRLKQAGITDLYNLVKRVSESNINAGYDVISFNTDGSIRYIEVKSVKTYQIQFYLSAAEIQFAEEHLGEYWLYFVPRAQDLPNIEHGLIIFSNPMSLIKEGLLKMEPTNFHIRMDINIERANDPRITNETIKQI